MNKFIKFLLIFTLIISTSSCYDKVELEDRDFVLTIGIDKYIEDDNKEDESQDGSEDSSEDSENQGDSEEDKQTINSRENIIEKGIENNRFTVTLSIPDPYAVTNHSDNIDKIIYGHGETVISAVDKISKNSGAYLDFAQAKVLILGKSLVEDEKLFKQTLDALERNKRLSRKVLILSSEHDAKDVINAKVKDVSILGYFLANYYSNNKTTNPHSSYEGLLQLLQSLEKSGDAIIPIITIVDEELNLSNALVIKDFEWEKIMYPEDLEGYTILNSDKHSPIFITTEFEELFIPLRSTNRSIDTYISYEDNNLYYNVYIDLEGSINEFSFDEKSLLDSDTLANLEESFNGAIKEDILSTYYFFQEVGVDGLNILDKMYKDNYDLYKKYEDTDKESLLKAFKPNININTKISSIGTTN